jgi:hypothetical protein
MYYVIDLRQNPPVRLPELVFETSEECIAWIDQNGNATVYSIEYEQEPMNE